MKSKFDVDKFFRPVTAAREIREEVARLRADLDVCRAISVADPKALTNFIIEPDVKASSLDVCASLDLRASPATEAAMGVVIQSDAATMVDEDDEWEDEDDDEEDEDDD